MLVNLNVFRCYVHIMIWKETVYYHEATYIDFLSSEKKYIIYLRFIVYFYSSVKKKTLRVNFFLYIFLCSFFGSNIMY